MRCASLDQIRRRFGFRDSASKVESGMRVRSRHRAMMAGHTGLLFGLNAVQAL
jgi:hypothetical protein